MARKSSSQKTATKKTAKKYYVKKVLAHRISGDCLNILVQWINHPAKTWEPELNIREAAGLACDLYFNKLTAAQLSAIRIRTGRTLVFNRQAFEVEKVLNIQRDRKTGNLRALVLWHDYPTQPTWQCVKEVKKWCSDAYKAYVAQLPDADKRVLKTGRGEMTPRPDQLEAECYEVERIEGLSTYGEEKLAFVKWLGCPDSDSSWEPLENVIDTAREAYEEYYNGLSDARKRELGAGFRVDLYPLPEAPAPARVFVREYSPEL